MNVRLLRKIIKVLRDPKSEGQFNINFWHKIKSDREGRGIPLWRIAPKDRISCNTTHCIAGWAQVLSPQRNLNLHAEDDARQLLGLTLDQSQRLFYSDEWPAGFGGSRATRKQAADRIELFIKMRGEV